MPRKKAQSEQVQQPTEESQADSQQALQNSSQTIQLTAQVITGLFEKKLALDGQEAANLAWDSFEESFVTTCEERFNDFVNILLPELQRHFTHVQQRSTDRQNKRQSILARIQNIASSVEATQKTLVASPMGFIQYEELPMIEGTTEE